MSNSSDPDQDRPSDGPDLGLNFLQKVSADGTKSQVDKTPSECQTVWIQIRTDLLSVLIWVKTVCKRYQQMTLKANYIKTPSECQTVWIQIRPDLLSGLIWVQTVCKRYHQTTLENSTSDHTHMFANFTIGMIGNTEMCEALWKIYQ